MTGSKRAPIRICEDHKINSLWTLDGNAAGEPQAKTFLRVDELDPFLENGQQDRPQLMLY